MEQPTRRKAFLKGAFVVYLALIWYLSSLPLPVKKVHVPFFDKVVHIILYAGLGAIVFELMLAHRPAEKLSMIFLFSLVCCSIYGALDEIHQKYVPGRTCSFGDFLADTAGTALGAYIAKLNSLRKKQ